MAEETAESILCPERLPPWVWVKSKCFRGKAISRDCLEGEGESPLNLAICNAYAWNAKDPHRHVQFWTRDKSTHLFTMVPKGNDEAKSIACHARLHKRSQASRWSAQFGGDDDPYTVRIPGWDDIVKAGATSDPAKKEERARKYRDQNSALPDFLKWAPKLLNKLDDAQDILQTGLQLAWPVLKGIGRIGYQSTIRTAAGLLPVVRTLAPRLLGPIGIALTINDLLNAFT
jgi:hypothetical protein